MEHTIDTIGIGTGQEKAVLYRAQLELTVVTSSKQEAAPFSEVLALRNRCIEALLGAGLRKDELREAGAAVWDAWWLRARQRERRASHTITLVCDDMTRLQLGLRALDPLFDSRRFTLELSMHAEYQAPEEAHRAAQAAAVADARKTAEHLAAAAGLRVTSVIAIADRRLQRRAGYEHAGEIRGLYSAGSDVTPTPLDAPTRAFSYEYQVRFACEPGVSA